VVLFALIGVALAFTYGVFRSGAGLGEDWYLCSAVLGLVSTAYGLMTPLGKWAPRPARPLLLLVAGLLGLCCFQIVPVPISIVRLVSPARASIGDALIPIAGRVDSATFSLAPAASFRYLVVFFSCAVAFFLARNIAWRSRRRTWILIAPFVVVAFLEAVLGLLQRYMAGSFMAQGTYVNRNHFAGLLEMALPFGVMGAIAWLHQEDSAEERGLGQTLAAGGLLLASAMMLAAIVYSLSRMGFLAALAGLLVIGLFCVEGKPQSRRGRFWLGGICLLAIAGFLFLPTVPLIERFGDLASSEQISADTRVEIWRETWQMVRDYPWIGVGLGGYESSFIEYKRVAPMNLVDFAHNDYLQYLAELGFLGFALLAFLVARTLVQGFRMAVSADDLNVRYFGIAAAGSLTAIGLHSLVDFNLYLPAHMMMVAWIAGTIDALSLRRQKARGPDGREMGESDDFAVEAPNESTGVPVSAGAGVQPSNLRAHCPPAIGLSSRSSIHTVPAILLSSLRELSRQISITTGCGAPMTTKVASTEVQSAIS
jgi:O-antigen ligase